MTRDAPPELRRTESLDGVLFTLSAYQHLIGERRRERLRTGVFVVGLLVAGLGFFTVGGRSWILLVMALGAAWMLLDDGRTEQKVEQTLRVGPHTLELAGQVGRTVRLTNVGTVRVRGGQLPVLLLHLAGGEVLEVPMELEPPEHAAWLSAWLERTAREARETAGSSAEVPQALRALEGS